MAVLVIIGIVLGVAFVRADSFLPSFEIDREAEAIALKLRDARNRAILSDRVIRVEIYPETHSIESFYDEPTPEEQDQGIFSDEPVAVGSWSDRVTLQRALIGRDEALVGSAVVLRFWPTGLATPVRLYLQHVAGGDLTRTVVLNPLTGLTTVLKGFVEPEAYEIKAAVPTRR
jgi:Tfp pilus assembly protein FimT